MKKRPLWWVKLTNYEYWPFMVLYFPTSFYWTWLIIKSRSLTFFTLANPMEEFGGFMGEYKSQILQKMNPRYLPASAPVRLGMHINEVLKIKREAGIGYPCIAKPNWGERGVNVEKVHSDEELQAYLNKTDRDSILQEFIGFPIELGVFYHRYPDGSGSAITGIVEKQLMCVTGDGQSTVLQLMEQSERARFQIKRLMKSKPGILKAIPAQNEVFLIEPIGNHNRGTKFIDGSEHIRPELVAVFDDIARSINGFYYGRLDVKIRDWESMYRGEGIYVLEVNGVYSEPAHIYDPGWKLLWAWREILRHMKVIYELSMLNKARGYRPSAPGYFIRMVWRNFLKNKQIV